MQARTHKTMDKSLKKRLHTTCTIHTSTDTQFMDTHRTKAPTRKSRTHKNLPHPNPGHLHATHPSNGQVSHQNAFTQNVDTFHTHGVAGAKNQSACGWYRSSRISSLAVLQPDPGSSPFRPFSPLHSESTEPAPLASPSSPEPSPAVPPLLGTPPPPPPPSSPAVLLPLALALSTTVVLSPLPVLLRPLLPPPPPPPLPTALPLNIFPLKSFPLVPPPPLTLPPLWEEEFCRRREAATAAPGCVTPYPSPPINDHEIIPIASLAPGGASSRKIRICGKIGKQFILKRRRVGRWEEG